jgi:hypothetical protein
MIDNAILVHVGTEIGIAFAAGVGIILGLTIITLPSAYLMNRIIYHDWRMRLLIGLAILPASFFAFIAILFMRISGSWDKVHFFGLFPVVSAMPSDKGDSWVSPFLYIFNAVIYPLTWFGTSAEIAQAVHTSMNLMSPGASGTVNEDVFEEARRLGGVSDPAEWRNRTEGLVAAARKMIYADDISI